MRVVFMGTPDFAVPTLETLIKNHEVVGVLTQPDKPKGRGKKIGYSPVKEVALENKIEVLQPESLNNKELYKKLESYDADIFVVVAYGKILSEELLFLPKYNSINMHGSLLPKYRGAAPIQWSIINGDKKTGVSIIYMDKGIDTGDVILKTEMDIYEEDTAGTLFSRMSVLGAKAVIDSLEIIENGKVVIEKQNDKEATYTTMIKKDMGHLNFDRNTNEILNLIKGLNPWPVAYIKYNDKILKIWSAEKSELKGDPGKILNIDNKKGIIVGTRDSSILIREIQAPNSVRMLASEFLKGNLIEEGKYLK